MNQYIEIIIPNAHLQEVEVEEEDNLQAQEQEVELEHSIVQLIINLLAISSYHNLQAWEEEDFFLFPFLEGAELAELAVVGLDGQGDDYIVA